MKPLSVRILLVEDNPLDARLIREIMKFSRSVVCAIESAETLANGLNLLKSGSFDAALLDLSLPDSEGMNTYIAVHTVAPGMPVIILTGTDDESLAIEAMQKGAQDYLVKGQLSGHHLERALSYAMERHKILDELHTSRQALRQTTEKLQVALHGINQELETAKLVQKAFLPHDISCFPGVSVDALYAPCGSVGGDFYDVVPVDENITAFLLLDVAGHGVPAALIAAMAKLSFSRNIKKGLSPAEVFERVNTELMGYLPPERFIASILAIFNARNGSLSLSRAGNPPAMILRGTSGVIEHVTTTGTFVGIFPDGRFGETSTKLDAGDKLLLYSDGLTECCNMEDRQLGGKGLSKLFLSTKENLTPPETTKSLMAGALAFAGKAPQRDDITILVATRL
jgi:sigma-B regulation protein RsbU (phosphoserine phosphatase)